MRVNSETSLRVATKTFTRFNGDWTAVHRAGKLNADGILVIGDKDGGAKTRAPAKKTKAKV
jgi:hypothetical protein